MNYKQALDLFTWRAPVRRKLCNKTYAHLVKEEEQTFVDVELFGKRIIRFRPDGSLFINNHNYWKGPTTKDRLNRFLPTWPRIHSYYVRPNQRAWLIWDRPYANAHYDENLHRTDLCLMNVRSARATIQKVQAYANDFSHALARGEVSLTWGGCGTCANWEGYNVTQQREAHLLEHLDSGYFSPSLLARAVADGPDRFIRDNLHNAWAERSILWKKPKTIAAKIAQLEFQMVTGIADAVVPPRVYRVATRRILEDFLLTGLGFELWNRNSSN